MGFFVDFRVLEIAVLLHSVKGRMAPGRVQAIADSTDMQLLIPPLLKVVGAGGVAAAMGVGAPDGHRSAESVQDSLDCMLAASRASTGFRDSIRETEMFLESCLQMLHEVSLSVPSLCFRAEII